MTSLHQWPDQRPAQHSSQPFGIVMRVLLDDRATALSSRALTDLAHTIRTKVEPVLPPRSELGLSLITDSSSAARNAQSRPQVVPLTSKRYAAQADHVPQTEAAPYPARPPQPRLLIDLVRSSVALDDKPLHLTHTELRLLNHLVAHAPRVIHRSELLESIWSPDHTKPGNRAIDIHIRRLRTKLGPFTEAIRSARREGYYFRPGHGIVVWEPPEYSI